MAAAVKRRLDREIAGERAALEAALRAATEEMRKELAPWALDLTIGEFLLLESVLERADAAAPSRLSSASTTVFAEPPPTRRMTRSMSMRKESLPVSETEWHDADSRMSTLLSRSTFVPPSTPRFHPGLPETPAAMRNARARRETSRPSVLTTARRSTVRGSIAGVGRAPSMAGANYISVQLDNGQTLDVDITQSPTKIAAGMGADALREVKTKMAMYASQLRVFFTRLRV